MIPETSEDHLDHHGVSQARNAAERVRSSIFRPQLSGPFGESATVDQYDPAEIGIRKYVHCI